MRQPPRATCLLVFLWAATIGHTATAEEPLGPGSRLETLTIGTLHYEHVLVSSVTARAVVIQHSGGLTSLRLRDLPPEWQARFHYNPATESPLESTTPTSPPPVAPVRPAKALAHLPSSRVEEVLRNFGGPAFPQPRVDLRPKFFELELGVKNQGRRPSCAIFAIVSALEFQSAELTGHAQKFSEEYLIWAVRKTVKGTSPRRLGAENDGGKDEDEGFALGEVVTALRAYGIPLQSSMPNTFGSKIGAIEEPPPEVIAEARSHQRVFIHSIPGRESEVRLSNIVHALNAGIPIPIGLAWPHYRTLRSGYISGQKPVPGAGHAVTLVGYTCTTGRLEDTVFVFKNSYGVDWGQGGYGTVTCGYLLNYLDDAVMLEVQPR